MYRLLLAPSTFNFAKGTEIFISCASSINLYLQQQGEITRDVVPCVFINNYSNGIPVTTNSTVDGIKWSVAPEKQTGKMQEHV